MNDLGNFKFCALIPRAKIGDRLLQTPLQNAQATFTPKISREAAAISEQNVHLNHPECYTPDEIGNLNAEIKEMQLSGGEKYLIFPLTRETSYRYYFEGSQECFWRCL